ncbi:MAG: hypothetical protein IT289_13525 [Oligoflexia bacterium]|nr:hypothetical protein [Oligoflexia bacterium]
MQYQIVVMLTLLVTFLMGPTSFAQSKLVGIPKPGVGWVEVSFPVSNYQELKEVFEEQKNQNIGNITLSGAWTPFAGGIQSDDRLVTKIFKSIGLTLDLSSIKGAAFPDFLYSIEKRVPYNSIASTCYSTDSYGDEYWDGTCYDCGQGVCQSEDVYGRDTYIKYVDGSIAFGMYLPMKFTEKILIQGGTNLRLHFVKEGIQTNGLQSSTETSINAVVRVSYLISDHWAITVAGEKSVSGLPYKSFSAGVTFRF